MPEEINRILTDRISSFLFCSSDSSIKNLKNEGFPLPCAFGRQKLYNFGDVMLDVVMDFKDKSLEDYPIRQWGIKKNNYALTTIHRPQLTDSPSNLQNVLESLDLISKDKRIVLPLHPRAKSMIDKHNLNKYLNNLIVLQPLSYLAMQSLINNSFAIITDSGGLQKEAMWHKKPCITLRNDTEWHETIDSGWNRLVGYDKKAILDSWDKLKPPEHKKIDFYGNGLASQLIVSKLSNLLGNP